MTAESPPVHGPSKGDRVVGRLLRNRVALLCLAFLGVLMVLALVSTFAGLRDPTMQDLMARLQGPSAEHWLGTDSLGRDNLGRLIEGTRTTLWAAVQAISVGVAVGIPTGLMAGFTGRYLDAGLSRSADVLLAMPPLILALAIVGILGPGLTNAMVAIGIVFAPRFFRVARSAALTVRSETYIEATRAMGCSTTRILVRHVLPNSSGPLLVQVTFALGIVVTAEASLSFLGLGAQPPTASWGSMVRDAFDNIYTSPSQLYAPAAMICLTILSFTLLGDALRDALGRQARTGE